MGRPKGALLVEGRPLAANAATLLGPLCGQVLISVPPEGRNPAPRYPAVRDRKPAGRGPLAGIGAAFEQTSGADLLVLACDYPQMTVKVLQALLSGDDGEHDLVLLCDGNGRDHPLVGLWKGACAGAVREALEDRRFKVRALLGELRVRRIHPPELLDLDLDRALINLNTPEDLAAIGVPPELEPDLEDWESGGSDEADPP